jgi:hypothetical protein
MSKLFLSLVSSIRTKLFGAPPCTPDDAAYAIRRAQEAMAQCLCDIESREQNRPHSTFNLKEVCKDIRIAMNDVNVYIRCQRWGMAVAVAQRMEEEFRHLHGLMEQFSGSATVCGLMRIYINSQGPVYPPRLTAFQRWMREQFMGPESRRRRLALR